jgi:hypothetical protein
MSDNFFSDNEDIRFYFERGVDWAALVEATEYGYRAPDGFKDPVEAVAFYQELASSMGELAAREVAPRAAQLDTQHATLENGEAIEPPAMQAINEAFRRVEAHRLCMPRELGGLNVPLMVYFLCGEMIARADSATMTHFSFHGGIAMASLLYSIREGSTKLRPEGGIEATRFQRMIEEIGAGEAWGCMDITEPDAGSDMARLRTRGEQDADGNWFVSGQKIFITSGHGKYHLVVARTEDASDPNDPAAGLQGLSMFLVEAYEDLPDGGRKRHVTLERLEEKMGHHGSITAAIAFDRAPAQLIGKRGEGFRYMLTLMNNARIGVGFECIGLAEAAYRMARAYASERRSMGKPIARHEMLADYLDEMRVDLRALRALAVEAAFHEELSNKLTMLELFGDAVTPAERARLDRDLPRHQARARRLTPLLKYLAAEKCVEMARRNIQIHGGVGFIKEYGAEKLLRDAIVLPIYEGTSQIQSLMAMKDTLLGIMKRPQDFARRIGQARWRSLSGRDELERGVARLQTASLGAQQHLLTRTAAGKLRSLADVPVQRWTAELTKSWDPKRDFALAMLHAERLTRLLADEAIAEILLEQARRFPERRELLERFLERAEPRARFLLDEITNTGHRILEDLGAEPLSKAAE